MSLVSQPISDLDRNVLLNRVFLLIVIGAGVAVALEPDHTENLPFLTAFVLWATHFLFAIAIFLTGVWMLERWNVKAPNSVVVMAVTLPLIFAPFSLLLDYGFGHPEVEFQAGESLMSVYLDEVIAVTPVIWILAALVVYVMYQAKQHIAERTDIVQDSPSLQSLISTIPQSLGTDVISVHAQDHYVEIVTTEGRALISEKFGSCVDRLEALDGVQCHRSHWVSLKHVETLTRSGSAFACMLSNGEAVPVSRRKYSDLKKKIRR